MLTQLPETITAFDELDDRRAYSPSKQHNLFDIIFISLCGTIAGCDTYDEMESFARTKIDYGVARNNSDSAMFLQIHRVNSRKM